MASYILPPLYAAFIWWFSTGAVLLLVGLSKRFDVLRLLIAATLLIVSLFGLAASSGDASASGAYIAFTCTILLWGAQEIVFLTGWVTGPRAVACPPDARGMRRFSLAIQAILYHEILLLACGAAIALLTWTSANQVGLWTFATLWALRQSSKINLFLGVPVTNEELMPDAVSFLKSFFARRSVSAFFPLSVTIATSVLVLMVQRLSDGSISAFETAGLALVSALFALGVLEHWFMLLPLPAIALWGWGTKPTRPQINEIAAVDMPASAAPMKAAGSTVSNAKAYQPQIVALSSVRSDATQPKASQQCARQRLEDQFRKSFLEENARTAMNPVLRNLDAEPVATVNGRTS